MATKRPPTPAAKAKAAPREKIVKKSVKKAPVKTPVKTRAKALAKVPAKTFPNPQSRFSLTGIAVQVQRVVDRFPLPVLAALVYTFLGWIGAVTGHWNGNNDLVPYMAHAGIGFYWFLAVQLLAASRGWSFGRQAWVAVAGFALLVLHYYMSDPLSAFLLNSAVVMAMVLAPYVGRRGNSLQFWNFAYAIFLAAALSFLFGIVLFLGMEAIFLSMNFLFGVELPAAVHGCAVFLVSGLIAPMLGLALVPASFTQERKGYPAYLKVVVAWAVAPLLAGYALVLYAYMLKILVLWTLPAGGVAWMVKGFACTGLLTYFILYPLARQGDRVAGLFCRYFFKALIPPLLLLAVALATRVFEYGVTEKRYMLLLSFTALVVATALSFRPRQERYLQTVFGVLTALVVLAAVGPLSAVNLSVFSQTHRLESLLVKYGRLADGQIVTSGPDIPWADVVSINSAVEFLVKRDRDDKLAPWFVAAKDNPFADGVADNGDEHIPGIFGRMFSFRDAEPIVKAMGIRYVPRWEYGQEATAAVEHFRFNFATANYYNGVTQVSGYDYMLQGSFSSWQEDPVIFALERPPVEVTGTLEGNSLTFVKASSGRRLTFDLAPLVQQLQQQGVAEAEATPPPAVLEARNADFRARLEVGELSGEYPDGDHAKPEVQSVQYRLFLRNQ